MRSAFSVVVFLALLGVVWLLRSTVHFIAQWWVFIAAMLCAVFVGSWFRLLRRNTS